MSAYDLTTVGSVKAWLGLPTEPTPTDATVAALVTASSRAICASLSRPALLPRNCTDAIDLESDRAYLSNWPVQSVASVVLDGLVLPPLAGAGQAFALGFLLQPGELAPPGRPQAIDIFGRRHDRRRRSLLVSYTAGYAIEGETQTAPSAAPYTISAAAPFGAWACDLGVAYANSGVALQAVSGAPAVGQYSVSAGVYRFHPGDAGALLIFSYGFIPQDLAQAATELAAERFRAAERIGLRSKSLGGQETISYDLSGVSASVEALIAPYRRTAF
jgi:hypothetical protein